MTLVSYSVGSFQDSGLVSPVGAADRARTVLILAIGYQIALLVPSLIAYAWDTRLIDGVSVWSKPIKFELSLIMTIGTVALLLPLLGAADRQRLSIRWSAATIALMSTLEISYLVLQSARGRASHFNDSTPIESVAYSLMGVAVLALVGGCFMIGLVIARRGHTDLGSGLKLGAATGLMLGVVLTVITAGLMSTGAIGSPGHWVGGVRSDANGLFLSGWSTSGGDLRVPHFFATHLMQALPLLGLMLDRLLPDMVRRDVMIRRGVWTGAILGLVVVVATFMQAFAGLPFIAVAAP